MKKLTIAFRGAIMGAWLSSAVFAAGYPLQPAIENKAVVVEEKPHSKTKSSSAELIFLSIASVLGIGWQIKKRID